MIGLLAFTTFPIIASLLLGFFNWPVIGDHKFTGAKNYQTLWHSKEFRTAIMNTWCWWSPTYRSTSVISLSLATWISSPRSGCADCTGRCSSFRR